MLGIHGLIDTAVHAPTACTACVDIQLPRLMIKQQVAIQTVACHLLVKVIVVSQATMSTSHWSKVISEDEFSILSAELERCSHPGA